MTPTKATFALLGLALMSLSSAGPALAYDLPRYPMHVVPVGPQLDYPLDQNIPLVEPIPADPVDPIYVVPDDRSAVLQPILRERAH